MLLCAVGSAEGTARAYGEISLSGYVVDAQTKSALPNAQVVFQQVSAPDQLQTLYTDASGRYETGAIVPGETYRVVVNGDSRYSPLELTWIIPAEWAGIAQVQLVPIELVPGLPRDPIQSSRLDYSALTRAELPDLSAEYHQVDDRDTQRAGTLGQKILALAGARQVSTSLGVLTKGHGCATRSGIGNYRVYVHKTDPRFMGIYVVLSQHQIQSLMSPETIGPTLLSCLGVPADVIGGGPGGGTDDGLGLQPCSGHRQNPRGYDVYDVYYASPFRYVCDSMTRHLPPSSP